MTRQTISIPPAPGLGPVERLRDAVREALRDLNIEPFSTVGGRPRETTATVTPAPSPVPESRRTLSPEGFERLGQLRDLLAPGAGGPAGADGDDDADRRVAMLDGRLQGPNALPYFRLAVEDRAFIDSVMANIGTYRTLNHDLLGSGIDLTSSLGLAELRRTLADARLVSELGWLRIFVDLLHDHALMLLIAVSVLVVALVVFVGWRILRRPRASKTRGSTEAPPLDQRTGPSHGTARERSPQEALVSSGAATGTGAQAEDEPTVRLHANTLLPSDSPSLPESNAGNRLTLADKAIKEWAKDGARTEDRIAIIDDALGTLRKQLGVSANGLTLVEVLAKAQAEIFDTSSFRAKALKIDRLGKFSGSSHVTEEMDQEVQDLNSDLARYRQICRILFDGIANDIDQSVERLEQTWPDLKAIWPALSQRSPGAAEELVTQVQILAQSAGIPESPLPSLYDISTGMNSKLSNLEDELRNSQSEFDRIKQDIADLMGVAADNPRSLVAELKRGLARMASEFAPDTIHPRPGDLIQGLKDRMAEAEALVREGQDARTTIQELTDELTAQLGGPLKGDVISVTTDLIAGWREAQGQAESRAQTVADLTTDLAEARRTGASAAEAAGLLSGRLGYPALAEAAGAPEWEEAAARLRAEDEWRFALRCGVASMRSEWQGVLDGVRRAGRDDVIRVLGLESFGGALADISAALSDLAPHCDPAQRPAPAVVWGSVILPAVVSGWLHGLFRARAVLDAYYAGEPQFDDLRCRVAVIAASMAEVIHYAGARLATARLLEPPPAGADQRYETAPEFRALPEVRRAVKAMQASRPDVAIDQHNAGFEAAHAHVPLRVILINPADWQ